MASSSYARQIESGPSFFKVILDSDTSNQRKLSIPLRFAREHEYIFRTKEICLKVEGAKWKVNVEKTNGRILFRRGWKEFSKFYSLAYAHMLTFRYEGNFCFNVTIYGKSCSEIIYPKLEREDCEEDCRIKDEEFWFENEFEDEQMLEDEKRLQAMYKPTRTLPSMADKRKGKGKGKAQVCLREEFREVKSHTVVKSRRKSAFGRIQGRAPTLSLRAIYPNFSVTMGPSYILTDTGRSYLNIPIGFAKVYLKESQQITLQDSDGNMWRIWCGVRPLEDRMKVEMRDGWRDFVMDNNLEVGDTCVFELIQTTPHISFRVTITQSNY